MFNLQFLGVSLETTPSLLLLFSCQTSFIQVFTGTLLDQFIAFYYNMSSVAQVGEIFSAAGTAFTRLAELTSLLQVEETAPGSQGYVDISILKPMHIHLCRQ